jgi:signal transduction histidine kinase/ligand-binding sensor domain-containing protein
MANFSSLFNCQIYRRYATVLTVLLFCLVLINSCKKEQNESQYLLINAVEPQLNQEEKGVPAVPSIVKVNPGELIFRKVGKQDYIPLRTKLPFRAQSKIIKGLPVSDLINNPFKIHHAKDLTATLDQQIIGQPEVTLAKDRAIKDRNPHSFSSFGKLQGLKYNVIKNLTLDRDGSIWISTSGGGASKYDGRFFTHFTEDQGLINNSINCILEDKQRNIWFGTEKGLSIYDGLLISEITFGDTIVEFNVKSLLEDKEGNVWVGTKYGIYVFQPDIFEQNRDITVQYYSLLDENNNLEITDMYEDKDGNLWFATRGKGVFKYERGHFLNFSKTNGFPSDNIESITQGKNGLIWFGSNGDGLISFDGDIYRHYNPENGFYGINIFSVQHDFHGNLWIGTLDHGLFKFDGSQFIQFTENEGLNSNDVLCILNDKSGNIWVGTDGGGLNMYQGLFFSHFTTLEGLRSNNIFSFDIDENKNIWIGTLGGGIFKFDGRGFFEYNDKNGLVNNRFYSIIHDKRGNIWMGAADDGIVKYDGKHFIYYTQKNGLSNNTVLFLMEDKSGNIWAGTRGGGVSKFIPDENGHGGTFENYNSRSGMSGDIVFSILQSNTSDLWFGTDRGLTRMVNNTFYTYGKNEGFSDKYTLSSFQAHDRSLWFGTMGDGMFRFDEESFTCFSVKEGLSNDVILSMVEDDQKNIWIGTRNGLSKLSFLKYGYDTLNTKFIADNVKFTSYSYEDGFLGIGTWRNSILFAPDKNIYIGANDRLTIFNPRQEPSDSVKIHLQIRSVDLFNEQIDWLSISQKKDSSIILGNGVKIHDVGFDSIARWNHLPEKVSLAFDNNFLTFHFLGITTNRPGLVKYQYKLDGLDKNWSALTTDGKCSYGYIPPGNYVFRVKAMNSAGIWSEENQYTFSIRPPWWASSWAYLVYFIILVLMVWWFDKFQKERILRTERLKAQETELKQAREIEKAYTELKSTQAQLIQSEKMASLGELTAGIAHEIQNPLNFVNNFSELNRELVQEAIEELEKRDISETKSILKDICENSDKINHHGKRADAIVKGMLMHSRSGSGQKEPTDINALVDEYLRLSYHGLRAKDKSFNAAFETHFDPNLPKVEVVPQDIGRVLLNLINNAFYAVDHRNKSLSGLDIDYKPTVTVATKNLGDKIEISVKDNGTGIPDDIKGKIFQPFFTTKPTGLGTGLGLSLSYDIVKSHGGGIKVESRKEKGSEFIINLLTA